jgi:ribosomal protein L22
MAAEEPSAERLEDRSPERMSMVLDPRPKTRIRWERRMVTRAVRKRGRLTKQEVIMRTERESVVKSHWFKTSVKKLGPLARQIAGKNIDEAILQMRFSKKKVAKDVMEHLKHAKNVAIVRYGMGLGNVVEGESTSKPITVTLKSGERKVITDPSSIYIAQAWVNRGPYDVDYDHRAMGRINIMRPPHTGLSVVLKEEKTRIREWKDREAKAEHQRKSQLWTHLPDRKISAQNQYYSW